MQDYRDLEQSVKATLAAARQRTGASQRSRSRSVVAQASRPAAGEWFSPLAQVLEEQRALCDAARRDLRAARAQRHRLEAELERHAHRQIELDQQLEVLDVRIELTRRRRRSIEPAIDAAQRQVERAREERRRLTRSVLETHDMLQRLTGKLNEEAGVGERR